MWKNEEKIGLTVQQFVESTATKKYDEKLYKEEGWIWECSSGKDTTAETCQLQNGHKKSCSRLRQKTPPNALDLTGGKFGKLTVVKRIGTTAYGRALWLCKCECGNLTEANATSLKRGEIVSCGCLKKQQIKHAREALLTNKSVYGVQIPQLTKKVRKDSGTGYKGIQRRLRNGKEKFEVSIAVKGVRKFIGTFNDLNDAIKARKQAEILYHEPYIKALENNKGKLNLSPEQEQLKAEISL